MIVKPLHSNVGLKMTGIGLATLSREALDAVHEARDNDEIINVFFKWAKYLVNWTRSGPEYYAGINITKRGQWPTAVCACASTQ